LSSTFKAEARFRVKTKIRLEVTISEQFQSNPADVKKYLLSRWWNLRGWRSSVGSVQGSCFNSQFFNSETSYNSVANEDVCGMCVPRGQVKIVSQNKHRIVVSERAPAKL